MSTWNQFDDTLRYQEEEISAIAMTAGGKNRSRGVRKEPRRNKHNIDALTDIGTYSNPVDSKKKFTAL